jgi:hypothetical protein
MSKSAIRTFVRLALAVAFVAAAGCAKSPPPVTEVAGVVRLDGQPLPHVKVEFVPDLSGFGAEMNSSAITDEQGRFTLTRAFTGQPGAVVAKHRVLITEAPTPGEFRSQDPQTQARYAQYMARLKNRPIPDAYGKLATALVVEVKADQKTYDLDLTRKP